MAIFGKSLAGAGYVVLNVIRAFNIVALLSAIAASSVMLVKTFIVSKFYFFDACEHVVTAFMAGFLILTELPLFKDYFARNWPLFSHKHGFVMLGLSMLLMGNSILGYLNKQATSQQSLGLPFWRLVIAAGIVVIIMGFINIVASYVFRDTTINLTARQVRSHGAVAPAKADLEAASSTPSRSPKRRSHYRSFFLGQAKSKRDSLPSYWNNAPRDMAETPKMQISSPVNNHLASPISLARTASSKYSVETTPHLQMGKPNLAHHPAMTSGNMI